MVDRIAPIEVNVNIVDSQGQPCSRQSKFMNPVDAQNKCIYGWGTRCAAPNSISLCNPVDCRRGKPTVQEVIGKN